jgi:hypothetical protein
MRMKTGPPGTGGGPAGGTAGAPRLRTGGAAAWADGLRRALGVLWLADGLVKILIPFGGRAADQAYAQIMTAETSVPGLHQFLAWQTRLILAHPFLWWGPAAVELCLGGWLLARPASRRALAASAGWALVVWAAGEGLGGLFGGASSILTGYPGAALLYAVAAGVLFPRHPPRAEAVSAAEAGIAGLWSRLAWLALWLGAAFVTALPQNGINAPVSMLFINQHKAPGPLPSIDKAELSWLTVGHTILLGIAVAVVCLAVGLTVFLGVMPRTFLALSAVIAVTGWVGMQNLAGVLTASSTDVGTGPVLVLLALAFWPTGGRTRRWLARQQPAQDATAPPAPQHEAQQPAGAEPAD